MMFSVAIASHSSPDLLDACLASVTPQASRRRAEIVVARTGGADGVPTVAARYGTVRFVNAADGANVPRLRAAGLAAAGGDVVALTEDHCVADDGWLDGLFGTVDADVVGGAMEGTRRPGATDWAAYFSEYGFFAARSNNSATPAATGANVAYRRSVVEEVRRLAACGEWENVIHDHLRAQGRTFAFIPTATVRPNQSYRFGAFCRDRFEHGRAYARRRLVGAPPIRRWLMLGAVWLLPPLLAARIARVIAPKERLKFLRALPITVAFLAAWAAGEWWGYLLGAARPGAAS